jgi:hypothetical protein
MKYVARIAVMSICAAACFGCGSEAQTVDNGKPAGADQSDRALAVFAASPETTKQTGITTWQVIHTASGVRTLGTGAKGELLSSADFALLDGNTPKARVEAHFTLPSSETIVFDSNGSLSKSKPMSDQLQSVARYMSKDLDALKASGLPYSWSCFWNAAAGGLACFAAAVEGGLNPLADGACVIGLGLAETSC